MYVAALWRYPVKSMAGESLSRVEVSASGLAGDRVVQVYRSNGRVATARTCPGLLGHRGTLDASGDPFVDGRHWTDLAVLDDVRRHVEPGATLVRDESDDRFDILPLLVATDGAIAAFGRDARRLRPNVVIGGVPGLAERGWPGHELRVGDVRIGVRSLRGRCVMTTFDPDTQAQDPEVLRDIVSRFGGRIALDCIVIQGGELTVGQPVELVAPGDASRPRHTRARPASQGVRRPRRRKEPEMPKHLECVVPDCVFAVTAASEDEIMRQVAVHAAHAHGLADVPAELAVQVKAAIKDQPARK